MHYLDEGSGPVVLCLHGNPTWSFYYRNLVKELRGQFRVIAPDFIGCGLSDHPTESHFRASQRMDQLEEFCDKLGLKSFSLVMHDWGGPIGTGFALRRFDSVERLVYLNTTLTEVDSLPKMIKSAAKPFIGRIITYYTNRFVSLLTKFGTVSEMSRSVKDGYLYPYRERSQRMAIWDFVADIPFDSSHPTYSDLLSIAQSLPRLRSKPVKILWGLKDPCFHREMLARVASHFPQAQVVEYPDASHLVLEDEPERTGKEILKFLSGEEGGVAPENHPPTGNALYDNFRNHADRFGAQSSVVRCLSARGRPRYEHVSFKELESLVNKFERGLTSLGLQANDRVLFLLPMSADFLGLALAVMGRGAVPVFVDPGVGKEKLRACLEDCKADVVIAVPKGLLLRYLWKKAFSQVRFFIAAPDIGFGGKHTISFLKKFSSSRMPATSEVAGDGVAAAGVARISQPDENPNFDRPNSDRPNFDRPAFVAYTSGGTGVPKGVVYTQQMLAEQLRILEQEFKLAEGRCDMPLLPIFALFNVGLGNTSVLPDMDPAKPLELEPEKVLRNMEDLKVQSSFGSPTLWLKIAEFCMRTERKIPHLRRIFIAGAPVSMDVLAKLRSVLPQGEVFTPYGATEALPVTLLSADDRVQESAASTGERGVKVGKPLSGTQVRVVAMGDAATLRDLTALPAGVIGEILVAGAQVSQAYLFNDEANRSSKFREGETRWHRMGDVGYFDEKGDLYFCGRKAHVVPTPSRLWFSIPVERIFNAHQKVRRSALVGLSSGEPAIVIEPLPQYFPDTDEMREVFITELLAISEADPVSRGIRHVFFHRSFPVDGRHNAKIFRDQLGRWASSLIDGGVGSARSRAANY